MWRFIFAWQGRLAFRFIRHDGVPQPLHHPLDVLLETQLARMADLEVHLAPNILGHVLEDLREELMPRLQCQHTPPGVCSVGTGTRQLVDDLPDDQELDRLQVDGFPQIRGVIRIRVELYAVATPLSAAGVRPSFINRRAE